MICGPCKKAADQRKPKKHLKCVSFSRGRTHCDCHHRTSGTYINPAVKKDRGRDASTA